MKQTQVLKKEEISSHINKIRSGQLYYVSHQCIEHFLKSGFWSEREHLLSFLKGNGEWVLKRISPPVFNNYNKQQKNILLLTETFIIETTFGKVTERYVVLGFLFQDKHYYSYIHSFYEKFIEEYLQPVT